MEKIINKMPLTAFVLGLGLIIGASAFKSIDPAPTVLKNQSSLYWYPVNSVTGKTTGPAAFHNTKSIVIGLQNCKDVATKPICLYGTTDPAFPVGDPVGMPSANFRILRTN